MVTKFKDKRLINLIRGWPAPALLPVEQLKASSAKVLSDPSLFVPSLQYGPDQGYLPLRIELSRYLSNFFSTTDDPERICITGGASQNLANILQSFTDPAYTQSVWVVAPCYHLACPIVEDAGFHGRLRAVPEDDEGIDLSALERGLSSLARDEPAKPAYKDPSPFRKAYRHVIYCVPTSANPSGKTMSLLRRQGLVRLARKYDALVICDDVYDFLQWPVAQGTDHEADTNPLPPIQPLPRLVDIDLSLPQSPDSYSSTSPSPPLFGNAISNGSFSKIIAPGCRTGWVEASPAFAFGLSQTGSTMSGGAPSHLCASFIADLLATGEMDAFINGVTRPALKRRHALLVHAVQERLGEFASVAECNYKSQDGWWFGGYFVWLTLKEGPWEAAEVARRAHSDQNLLVGAGDLFRVKGDEGAASFERNIRLCFAWEDEDQILEGVDRLACVFRSWNDTRQDGSTNKAVPTSGFY